MSTGGPRKETLLTLSGGTGHILLRPPRGWREEPGMTLQRAKPHRSSTEAPRSPAGSRAGLEGGSRGSQDSCPPPSHPSLRCWQGPPHRHLKSQEPAARSTLLGCQSRLRMVERMGFLMCLQTHLDTAGRQVGRRRGHTGGHPPTQRLQAPTGPCRPQRSQEEGAWAQASNVPGPTLGGDSTPGLATTLGQLSEEKSRGR